MKIYEGTAIELAEYFNKKEPQGNEALTLKRFAEFLENNSEECQRLLSSSNIAEINSSV